MPVGPGGKYDKECEELLRSSGGAAVAVVVIDGMNGSGFSLSTVDPALAPFIAKVFRQVADEIESSHKQMRH